MQPEPFGRYLLIHKLATGGMGEVLLARQSGPAGFDRFVAVKRLLPHLAEDGQFVQMFLDEARLAAMLTHPNICQLFEFGCNEGSYYLAMEYLSGEALSAILETAQTKGKPLAHGVSAYIVAHACEGLHYAHERTDDEGKPLHLVHRDVSPSNIFLSFDGNVKLLDFGIAKAANRIAHTATGSLKGKYGYIAPEAYQGAPLDRRTDLFSMGVVLWELLTKKRLYKREAEYLVGKAIVEEPPPDPRDSDPTIPAPLAEIALKALAKKPDERFQTALEMRRALTAFLRTLPEEVELDLARGGDGGALRRAQGDAQGGARAAARGAEPGLRSQCARGDPGDVHQTVAAVRAAELRPARGDHPGAPPAAPARPGARRGWGRGRRHDDPRGGLGDPAAPPAGSGSSSRVACRRHRRSRPRDDAWPHPAAAAAPTPPRLSKGEPARAFRQAEGHAREAQAGLAHPGPAPEGGVQPRQARRPVGDAVRLSLLALLLVFASTALGASPGNSPEDDQKARERYAAGDTALQLGRYDDAIQAFEDAYRLSHRVGILYNIGLAYRRAYSLQGKPAQLRRALEMYESFLRQAHAVPDRAQIEGVTAQLRAQVAAEDERERLAQLREAAGSPALQEAMKLYADGKPADALDALERLLQKGGNPTSVLEDIYRVEAEISAQSGQPASSDEAFEKLLALSPSFKPPQDAAAPVLASFGRAAAYWEGKPSLRISPRVPPSATPGVPLAIPVLVEEDPLLMVARLTVHYRPFGSEAYSTVTRDGPGDLVISGLNLPAKSQGYRVEYFLDAADRAGNVLAAIGGPTVPLSFPVLSKDEVARAAAAARPWYKNPWVWSSIVVGAAVLGGGAALLVQRGPPASDFGNINLPK